MRKVFHHLGARLYKIPYVKRAVDEKAGLEAFRKPPSLKIVAGILLLILSFVMCWPAISTLGAVALYLKLPWIAVVGGPVLYGLSHVVYMVGFAMAGVEHINVICRWSARKAVERLVGEALPQVCASGPAVQSPPDDPGSAHKS